MTVHLFSNEDLKTMAQRGINVRNVLRQLEIFRQGTKPIKLLRAARLGDGIVEIPPAERDILISLHEEAAKKGRMLKFVPASGVASRMFNDWHRWYRQKRIDSGGGVDHFLNGLGRLAFYEDLRKVMASRGKDLEECLREKSWGDILEFILTPRGLSYYSHPKALLKFHTYPERARTALEEHLVEAAFYVKDAQNICRIHFTVSPEHESHIQQYLFRVKTDYERCLSVSYEIDLTIQDPSTDTLAVDMENKPFREEDGHLLFRPAGHGALLQNLNAIDGDILFIKNIDNVVPDRLKDITIINKKILGGYLVQLQNEIFYYLNQLSENPVDSEMLPRAVRFCQEKLFLSFPHPFWKESLSKQKEFVLQILHRPLRVCGMVKNRGEPGGGPFWVEQDGVPSLQIIEQGQFDLASEGQREIWESSTHFNPVDLVCGVRDFQGKKFDLTHYVDQEAILISKKFHGKVELKALELPGLWNGSMAYWNTVFVEVPMETFNPVKTIEDLLRESHQPL